MKKACVVKAHNAGLFSLINKVITCAEIYGPMAVDLSGSYYGEDNVWDALFLPVVMRPDLQADEIDLIDAYPHMRYTATGPASLYRSKDQSWRHRLHAAWRRVAEVRPEIEEAVDTFIREYLYNEPFNAVMIRATTHAGEQINGTSQTLDEYLVAIDKNGVDKERLFVMTGDEATKRYVWDHWGATIYPHTRRSENRDIDFHLHNPQTFEDAKNCLIEVLIASRAQKLVHPVSNMATAALYINPELESIYLP